LILSAHLYDVMTRTQIANVYQRAVTANLPFIVGEFAHRAPAGGCGPALDYLALIARLSRAASAGSRGPGATTTRPPGGTATAPSST
jgi:hypothetical protein